MKGGGCVGSDKFRQGQQAKGAASAVDTRRADRRGSGAAGVGDRNHLYRVVAYGTLVRLGWREDCPDHEHNHDPRHHSKQGDEDIGCSLIAMWRSTAGRMRLLI
jgi:hypothetical protein